MSNQTLHPESQIVDISGGVPELRHYYFIADTANSTVNGFFVRADGARTGSLFTSSVTTTTAVRWTDIYGAALPTDAVGAVVDITTDLRFDVFPAQTAGDVTANKTNLQTNKAKAPTIRADKNIPIARVG